MEKERKKETEKEVAKLAGATCKDRNCPTHGSLKTRGRFFEGTVIKKFPKRITIEF
jgi:hypothetical protein